MTTPHTSLSAHNAKSNLCHGGLGLLSVTEARTSSGPGRSQLISPSSHYPAWPSLPLASKICDKQDVLNSAFGRLTWWLCVVPELKIPPYQLLRDEHVLTDYTTSHMATMILALLTS